MQIARIFMLGIFALAAFPTYGVADEHLTCEQVLSNTTFRDALTRNDGHDFPVLSHSREGHQLIGLHLSLIHI